MFGNNVRDEYESVEDVKNVCFAFQKQLRQLEYFCLSFSPSFLCFVPELSLCASAV